MKTQQEALRKFALTGIIICSAAAPPHLGANPSGEEGKSANEGGMPGDENPSASYKILAQHRIDLGERTIIYNLISPPVFFESAAKRVPSSPQEKTNLTGIQKDYLVIWLSANIYNRKVTEISWGDENHQYRAFSNIDFNLMENVTIETSKAFYSLLFLLSNSTISDDLLTDFSSSRVLGLQHGGYVLDSSRDIPPPEDMELLNSIHSYHDAHKAELLVKHQEREEERYAREEWLKSSPSALRDTIINFWPIKSSIYLNSDAARGKK